MPTKVVPTSYFTRDLKSLSKKYKDVTDVVEDLGDVLKSNNRPGDKIPNVGYDVYKVRLPNPSAGKGKSGGFRVIYYVQLVDRILLLTIYSKTEQSDVSADTLRQIIEEEEGE